MTNVDEVVENLKPLFVKSGEKYWKSFYTTTSKTYRFNEQTPSTDDSLAVADSDVLIYKMRLWNILATFGHITLLRLSVIITHLGVYLSWSLGTEHTVSWASMVT